MGIDFSQDSCSMGAAGSCDLANQKTSALKAPKRPSSASP